VHCGAAGAAPHGGGAPGSARRAAVTVRRRPRCCDAGAPGQRSGLHVHYKASGLPGRAAAVSRAAAPSFAAHVSSLPGRRWPSDPRPLASLSPRRHVASSPRLLYSPGRCARHCTMRPLPLPAKRWTPAALPCQSASLQRCALLPTPLALHDAPAACGSLRQGRPH
jgi:hypothetical protein